MKKIEAIIVAITLLVGYLGVVVSEENLTPKVDKSDAYENLMTAPNPEDNAADADEGEMNGPDIMLDSGVQIYDPEERVPFKPMFTDEVDEIEIPEIVIGEKNDKEDPVATTQRKPSQTSNVTHNVSPVIPSSYKTETGDVIYTRKGIDVSGWQDEIDWAKVAASGVKFAMIRTGYRGTIYGKIVADHYVYRNIEGALANGIEVGVYFYSMAINEKEAREEAAWVCNLIKNYNITYPVAYDLEELENPNIRISKVSFEQFNKNAVAFLNYVAKKGYTPCLYGCKSYLNNVFDMRLFSNCYIWLAHVGVKQTTYRGRYDMWQYSWTGKIPGIYGNVDMNVEYRKASADHAEEPEDAEDEDVLGEGPPDESLDDQLTPDTELGEGVDDENPGGDTDSDADEENPEDGSDEEEVEIVLPPDLKDEEDALLPGEDDELQDPDEGEGQPEVSDNEGDESSDEDDKLSEDTKNEETTEDEPVVNGDEEYLPEESDENLLTDTF